MQILQCFLLALVLVAGDFVFFWTHFGDKYPRHFTAVHETFGLLLLLSLAFRRRGFYISIGVLSFMAFAQMCHLSFFGSFVHPTKIYMFFTQLGEIGETMSQTGKLLAIPLWIFLFSLVCLWGSSLLFKQQNKIWKPLRLLLVVALLYIPVRTVIRKDDYGKQPAIHNMAFSNLYASFSYFFARTLPFKLSRHEVEVARLKFEKIRENPQVNVVFILGESLRYQNMQLFGYDKPTTPHLLELSHQVPFVARKGVAGGVCTDVAIPMFMNNYQSTAPMPVILSQDQCLFKLAKGNGFETHFYSAQAEGDLKHIINYICTASIDHMKIGPGISLMEDKEKRYYDDILLQDLAQVDFSKPQFLVLHQRGSHLPYNLRYPPEKAVFAVDPKAEVGEQMITEYNNSVAFTDEVVSQIIRQVLQKSKIPTYIIFTSDHGQVLGEGKVWGHNELNEYVFKIPFVFVSSAKDALYNQVQGLPTIATHKDMSDLLVQALGYRNPNLKPQFPDKKVFVMGYDLDGLEGGMWVHMGDHEIESVTNDDLSPLKN